MQLPFKPWIPVSFGDPYTLAYKGSRRTKQRLNTFFLYQFWNICCGISFLPSFERFGIDLWNWIKSNLSSEGRKIIPEKIIKSQAKIIWKNTRIQQVILNSREIKIWLYFLVYSEFSRRERFQNKPFLFGGRTFIIVVNVNSVLPGSITWTRYCCILKNRTSWWAVGGCTI